MLMPRAVIVATAASLTLLFQSGGSAQEGCLSCHEGIDRSSDGPMQETIEAIGADFGDPGGCVVCHGGTPDAGAAGPGDAPRHLRLRMTAVPWQHPKRSST